MARTKCVHLSVWASIPWKISMAFAIVIHSFFFVGSLARLIPMMLCIPVVQTSRYFIFWPSVITKYSCHATHNPIIAHSLSISRLYRTPPPLPPSLALSYLSLFFLFYVFLCWRCWLQMKNACCWYKQQTYLFQSALKMRYPRARRVTVVNIHTFAVLLAHKHTHTQPPRQSHRNVILSAQRTAQMRKKSKLNCASIWVRVCVSYDI